jgi:hypothetical protein
MAKGSGGTGAGKSGGGDGKRTKTRTPALERGQRAYKTASNQLQKVNKEQKAFTSKIDQARSSGDTEGVKRLQGQMRSVNARERALNKRRDGILSKIADI